ncbi:hypothetical protein BJ980_001008 [Nocardioides daedukensis]|uniref:Uncharacterized protein n=1 Tax=Nocardioides daedukensis TaxID=634462 RepID=A0A7Y9S242_9ACTN|nr:hypothetical protein [Nocardioides daedukensis]NYG58085.1 hypothetical protein [Nocardioides daedukensis]
MEIVVVAILVLTAAVSMAGWRTPGRGQVVLAVALFAGLGAAAALLGFDDRTIPAGSATVVDVALLGILAVGGGGVITTSIFRLIDGTRDAEEGSMRQAGEVLRGGAWIGGLERTAVFASVVAAWPSGLAIILALKGLGRYAELRSSTPGAAERFIIGTFASVLWAIACAGTALLAIA